MAASEQDNELVAHELPPKPSLPVLVSPTNPHPSLLRTRGERCVLVPYGVEHVPLYHSWMQQQDMLDATASERLTLEQEYANQASWTQDPHSHNNSSTHTNTTHALTPPTNRSLTRTLPCISPLASPTHPPTELTFIILDPALPASPSPASPGCMCGDCNLFRHSYLPPHTAELEVMIAHPPSQRKGIASEAIRLLMQWARQAWGVHRCVVKVGGGNERSLRLFRERLGWTVTEYVDVFDEYEMWSPPCTCETCPQQAETSSAVVNDTHRTTAIQ